MLTESKGNMYPGVKTWNPLGGECPHRCAYCSTKSMMRYPVIRAKYSGPLTYYFGYPPFENKTVFVCAQNDLFADKVPSEWISEILEKCWAKENVYLFQSKNPKRFKDFLGQFPLETILCTTIETNRIYDQMGEAPLTLGRAWAMSQIEGITKQVTIEPIFDFDLEEMIQLIKMCNPVSVNIGADSKHNHLPEPSKEKILALIDGLQKFTIIDQKRNLQRLLK